MNAGTLEDLITRLRAVFAVIQESFEIILVNDASPDGSFEILEDLKTRHASVSVIHLSRNLGQQGAIRAGLVVAKGDVVVVLDADLQDPPEAIPSLIEHLGSQAVDAVFAARSGHYQSTFRMCCSWSFRWLIRTVTRVPRGAGGYVAMSRRMVDRLLASRNRRFYLAGLIGCSGYPVSAIPVRREIRRSERSAYTGAMRFSIALSNIACVLDEKLLSWR